MIIYSTTYHNCTWSEWVNTTKNNILSWPIVKCDMEELEELPQVTVTRHWLRHHTELKFGRWIVRVYIPKYNIPCGVSFCCPREHAFCVSKDGRRARMPSRGPPNNQ
jgi:hypothetical protein